MEMMWALCRFSTGGRHFMCQELHGLNGFHLGDKIALFVYTRGEQWVIFKRGPNQNGSNEKFIMFHWDTELEILQDLFLSRGGRRCGAEQFMLMGLRSGQLTTSSAHRHKAWRVSCILSFSYDDASQWIINYVCYYTTTVAYNWVLLHLSVDNQCYKQYWL